MSLARQAKQKIFLGCFISVIICFVIFFAFFVSYAETFVWQDFEYWDSPHNHGWLTSTPHYPVFGPFPIGYGLINTVIDIRLHSRVLKIEGFPSPFNQFNRFNASNHFITYTNGQPINDKEVISLNIAGRFAIEQFDHYEIQIRVITRKGKNLNLIYRPIGIQPSGPELGALQQYNFGTMITGDPDNPMNPLNVVYNIGRQYIDGTWHLMVRDLEKDIKDIGVFRGINFQNDGFGKQGFPHFNDPENSKIVSITLFGFNLMVDNISFHDSLDNIINHPPKLQRIGPQFAQIFEKFSYIISVNDVDDNDDFYVFTATVGGYGASGIQTSNMVSRIKKDMNSSSSNPIDPNYYTKCDYHCFRNYCGGSYCNEEKYCMETFGGSYTNGECCVGACEGDRIMLEFIPQTFEDIIVTIKVTDPGGLSDIETFPLFVVNYPITNHPPYLEEIEDDVYLLGENDGYYVKEFICYDQDLEDDPGNGEGEFPTLENPYVGGRQGNITYRAYIDGQPNYRYGPWQEPLLPDRLIPMITFSPKFEGSHNIFITATDQKGYSAFTEFTLNVVKSGTWLNHPPILCEDIDSPQIGKAGENFTIPIEFFDPDLEQTYFSCNIGSITEMTQGFGITPNSEIGITIQDDKYGRYVSGAVYNFLTNFPGIYYVEIVAYDIRGGYCIVSFILDIQPWWAV